MDGEQGSQGSKGEREEGILCARLCFNDIYLTFMHLCFRHSHHVMKFFLMHVLLKINFKVNLHELT